MKGLYLNPPRCRGSVVRSDCANTFKCGAARQINDLARSSTLTGRLAENAWRLNQSAGCGRRPAPFRFHHGDQGPKREHELLENGKSLSIVLTDNACLPLAKCPEQAINQDQRIGVVAAGVIIRHRMVQTMGFDRREDVRIPAGSGVADIGMCEVRHDAEDVQRTESGILAQVE